MGPRWELCRQTLYIRRRRRQKRLLRAAGWLVLAAVICLCAPMAAAGALLLPEWLARQLTPAYEQRLDELRVENFALRTQLAAAASLKEENTALRELIGCPVPEPGPWLVGWVAGRTPGGMLLFCDGGTPAPGAAVLDRQGRYAGAVEAVRDGLAAVRIPGSPGARAAGQTGVLKAAAAGWMLADLPLPTGLKAGTLATTLDGHWLGRLASAPQADADGLTADAPLTDTADLCDAVYFVAAG